LDFAGAMTCVMLFKLTHIRCHQEPCQSGIEYQINVLKILKEKEKQKDPLNH